MKRTWILVVVGILIGKDWLEADYE